MKVITFIKSLFKNHWKILTLLLLIAFAVGYYFNSKQKSSTNFTYSAVEKRNIVQVVSASGKVKSDEEATLKFLSSGQLVWVGVKKGDFVKQWQAIASLDRKELEEKLKQELIDYMNKRWDLEQTGDNYKDKSFDALAGIAAQRVKDKAQWDMDRTVLDVEIADIALKYATLVSPIDGIITKIDAPNTGVNIVASTTEFVVANPDKMIFSANVDEGDIGKVKIGQTAKIVLDAYPNETFEATIQQIDFTPTLTSGGGLAYAVKFQLPTNTNTQFKLEMNGDSSIVVNEASQALSIPQAAIRENTDNKYVWIKTDKGYDKRIVKTGISDDTNIEIFEGLDIGDKVITSGFKYLEK